MDKDDIKFVVRYFVRLANRLYEVGMIDKSERDKAIESAMAWEIDHYDKRHTERLNRLMETDLKRLDRD